MLCKLRELLEKSGSLEVEESVMQRNPVWEMGCFSLFDFKLLHIWKKSRHITTHYPIFCILSHLVHTSTLFPILLSLQHKHKLLVSRALALLSAPSTSPWHGV